MAEQQIPKLSGVRKKLAKINITNWKGGYNSFLDDGRLPINALKTADNIILDQDGVPRVGWGDSVYGEKPPVDGVGSGDDKFVKWDQDTRQIEEWLISVIDGEIYIARDGMDWQKVEGVKLSSGHECSFLQIDDKVFIANGHDNLCYYDIEENIMKSFTPLKVPNAPKLERSADLTSGNYTCYYRITAVNDVGETKAGAAANINVNVMRDSWQNTTGSAGKAQNITLTWDKVDGAARYNIYYGDASGQECYIDSTANTSYNDDARTSSNITLAAPEDDTTGGPKMSVLSYSDNRMWGTGDPMNPYRIYWGGVGQNNTSFSPFFGGGWIDIAKGGAEIPVVVKSYRDGKGESVNTVFMAGANGRGSQYQITLNTMTVGTTTFVVPMVSRVVGSLGTTAPGGVVEAKNNLFFPSTQSFNTTGAKPDMLNVLSTDEISLAVRPNVRSISNRNSKTIQAIYYEGKIFWAVPYGTGYNNEVWILDLELNTWVRPWRIGVKKFISYVDSAGKEHLLYRPSYGDVGALRELSSTAIKRGGAPFEWTVSTGLLNFDETHMSFERVKKVYFEFLRTTGPLTITVYGSKKNKPLTRLKSFTVAAETGFNSIGVNNAIWNEAKWNEAEKYENNMSLTSLKKVVKIQKLVNNLQIEISGKSTTNFSLGVISVQGTPKTLADPSGWKK